MPEVEKVARSTSFASKLLTFGEQHLLFILVSVHTLHSTHFQPKSNTYLANMAAKLNLWVSHHSCSVQPEGYMS